MSSVSPGSPGPGLLPDVKLVDLNIAWQEREEEARELLARGYNSMALALRLYALEIRIKTVICKHLGLQHLPRACKTHDLTELVIFTGMWAQLQDPANAAIRQNWDILAEFSKLQLNDQRYLPRSLLDPKDLKKYNDALDDTREGVLSWLSRSP